MRKGSQKPEDDGESQNPDERLRQVQSGQASHQKSSLKAGLDQMSQTTGQGQGGNRNLHTRLPLLNHKVGSFCLLQASAAFTTTPG
jgi:hypothetical protein